MATLVFKDFGKDAAKKFADTNCIQEGQDKRKLLKDELRDEYEFDACVFDEDKMMTHILDCYAALCAFQQYRGGKEQSNKLDAKTQQAKNKAFKIALSLMSKGMTHDDAEKPKNTPALSTFLTQFPDDTKLTDGRGWMPLHWALFSLGTPEGDQLNEDDVKLLYAIDIPALQRFHDSVQDQLEYPDERRFTPAHFLCIQPVTPLTMSLLRYFTMCNLPALISSTYTSLPVLHATCQFGQPTEELLQLLLQLDSSQVTEECGNGFIPLEYLCQNDCCSERLMICLLQFDSSVDIVAGAIQACFGSADHSRILEKMDIQLKANPEAVQHRFDGSQQNLLHRIALQNLPSVLCIDIMKRILNLHPDAVKEVDDEGELPVHLAAKNTSLEVMEFLLGLYPESATTVTAQSCENLLHEAVFYSSDKTAHEAKIRYLCSRYPEFILQRTTDGHTPFLRAMYYTCITGYVTMAPKILCEFVGVHELVRMPIVLPTESTSDDTDDKNGWLPLHLFILCGHILRDPCSHLSAEADFFRLLLRWYPEAAGIEAGNGTDKKTPYQLAVERRMDPYFLRLLLRTLNPVELHRLNWAERRMAMFMAFRAITGEPTPLLLARLRFENKDLVKNVVSFL